MCLAVPALITDIKEEMATVDVGGVTRTVSLMLTPSVMVGDYVIIHAGFALHKVEEAEAMASLELLREMVQAVS